MVELSKVDFLVQMIYKWLHQVLVDSMVKIIMMMIWAPGKQKRHLE
jgi:hypothetical protein